MHVTKDLRGLNLSIKRERSLRRERLREIKSSDRVRYRRENKKTYNNLKREGDIPISSPSFHLVCKRTSMHACRSHLYFLVISKILEGITKEDEG